ncbi:protein-disulfide reductase DsbD [Marinomonas colpomeniae]|uniref:Protein-disulfide reductase DsbD n=1 Tax=Marinomonas colpomeniae TaxID=2774408 RepID=A0ABR8NX39_9GAMM|nr:protein-disulfide reductase DsbD [Marinomonas colpomeniae]MBD5770064.1 protein-disulfide reductase DsbD [Marinomonas colpomeniae]
MRLFVLLFLLLFQNISMAFTFAPTSNLTKPDFLPVEQAFQLFVSEPQDGKLIAEWQIHDGYYLYQEQFNLSGKDAEKLHFSPFPQGETKQDPYFGEVTTYRNKITLPIYYDINLPAGTKVNATLGFQGCADAGLCYAPQKVQINFTVPLLSSPDLGAQSQSTNVSSASITNPSINSIAPSESQSVSLLLESSSPWTALVVLFGLGLLLSLTPCVLPMVPIVSAIVVGTRSSKTGAFYYSLVYVLAMAFTYAAIGGLVGIFGTQLNLQAQLQNPILLAVSAVIFLLLSLAMFGVYELKLPSSWQQRLQTSTNHSNSVWRTSGSVFLAGVLSTLIVSPCVSAPLAGTLLYISGQGNAWYGAMMLFIMALGMGVPLLLVGLFGPRVLPKNGEWLQDIKNLMGFGLIAVSIWLVTRWLPENTHLYLWGLLAIAISSYFIHRASQDTSHPIRWFLAMGFFLVGTVEFLGGTMGNTSLLHPLKMSLSTTSTNGTVKETATFDASIKSLSELNNIVANQDGRPVMLDLYADWCISCKEVEAMFVSPEIQPMISKVQLIRVDVTENSAENKALMKKFNLFGPPSLIFLDAQGKERQSLTLMGEPTKADIIERLNFIINE